MRLCLLEVRIKEINHLDQPKPQQGLAHQRHTVPAVGQRGTATANGVRGAAKDRTRHPGVDGSAELLGYPLPGGQAKPGRSYQPNDMAARAREGSEATGPPERGEAAGSRQEKGTESRDGPTSPSLEKPARCHREKENKSVTTTRGKKINFQAQNTSPSCKNKGTAMAKQEHKGAARKGDGGQRGARPVGAFKRSAARGTKPPRPTPPASPGQAHPCSSSPASPGRAHPCPLSSTSPGRAHPHPSSPASPGRAHPCPLSPTSPGGAHPRPSSPASTRPQQPVHTPQEAGDQGGSKRQKRGEKCQE